MMNIEALGGEGGGGGMLLGFGDMRYTWVHQLAQASNTGVIALPPVLESGAWYTRKSSPHRESITVTSSFEPT